MFQNFDQIKLWIGSSDSKEGLALFDRLTPEEEAKLKTTSWISEAIKRLHQLVEERDVEIEQLGAGK